MEGRSATAHHSNGQPRAPTRQDLAALAVSRAADARRRLLARGLAFQPDVVIANGDQIYWDLRTIENKSEDFCEHFRQHWWGRFGTFDRSMPANCGDNDAVLQAVCDYQIAGLYGCALRSTPSYFQTDDHDMFENDEFDPHLATLPPGEFGQGGEDATQLRSYPEFLPTSGRPSYLWGSTGARRAPDVNQFFGALRYGRLAEVVMYDCRRFVDSKGIHARAVPKWTEEWLKARTLTEDTHHFMHSPSLPFGYSSGKLGDWYPDVLDPDGQIGRLVDYLEQSGQLDNTIVFYCSDNGTSGEGSPNGSVNENKFFNNFPDELSENMKYIDVLGGVET